MANYEKSDIDNIIRISSRKEAMRYIYSIFIRGQPNPYTKYNCIKIRFVGSLAGDVDRICRNFWHWGLVPERGSLKKIKFRTARGEVLGNAFELTLHKLPMICFEDDSEYHEWLPELKKLADEQVEGLEEED